MKFNALIAIVLLALLLLFGCTQPTQQSASPSAPSFAPSAAPSFAASPSAVATQTPKPSLAASPSPSPSPSPTTRAAPEWVLEEGTRLNSGVSPFALRVGDGVVLYFTDIGGIFRASSGDGLNFGAPVKVIEAGSNSAIFPLSGGGYRMIYNPMFPPEPGQYHQSSQYFLSARSADGLNWVLEEGVRFRSADAPDYDGISVPCVVDIGNGRLRMYFVGDMYGPELGREGNNIRSTLSSDEGLSWQREDGVRIERTSMDPAVIKTSEGYWLYFTAPHEDKKFGEMRVYAAFSSDGLVFGEPQTVLTPPNAGERFMDPEFIETENEMRMYVSLASGEGAAERTKLVSAVLKR